MSQWRTGRRLEAAQRHVVQARQSLEALKEQAATWNEALDDARLRALMSETPQAQHDFAEISRQAEIVNREVVRREAELAHLVAQRDELLRQWSPKEVS
jgi:chromosome segregation ATPase